MNAATFKTCKDLHAQSGWENTDLYYLGNELIHRVPRLSDLHPPTLTFDDCAPAYTTDFILQAIVDHSSLEPAGVLRMLADYITEGESFADAACRLAISMFRSGILERQP